MSQYIINTGNIANDGQGDPLRTAFTDTNLNFNQIWAAGPVNSNITIANNTILTTNTNGNLILATNGIGAIIAAQSVVPDLSNVRMVGGPNNRFNTVYSQYLDISGIVTAGNLSVSGNLYVAGNTVTVNQSNLSVSNTLITLAANATIPVEADGGGIFIAGANASLTYSSSLDSWVANIALSVQGNVSANYFVGDGSGLSNLNVSVDANTLTGNRLNSGVVFSNLTTVGTLTSLTVDGNVLAGNITATFYGDGSHLSNLGNVGNAVYATFAGTAATANLAAEAVTAINADTALYAVNANTANTANFALTSNCAIYADTATTAILANSAIVANVALFAQSVGVLANLSVTGNIVTGGILTNNYYYANGTPFAGGGGSGSIIQSPTAPLNPTSSTLWWDEVSGRLYVYYDDGISSQWVDAAPAGISGSGGGGTASLIQSPTPPLNPTANTLWWDEVSGRLYVYYDDGTSSQWVDASPAGTGGGGSTGNITFNGTTISTNLADTDITIQGNGTGAINITTGANSYIGLENDSYTNGSSYVYLEDGSVYAETNGGLWIFDNTGNLRFPDSTVQTTAYTGQNGGATDWANIGNISNANGPTTILIGQNTYPSNTYDIPNNFVGVIWDGAQFVAVGIDLGGQIITAISPDGATWTNYFTTYNANPSNIVYNGSGQYVIFGSKYQSGQNSYILTSSDAINWTEQPGGTFTNVILKAMVWNGAQYVGVGTNNSTHRVEIVTSPDGVTWTQQVYLQNGSFLGITWSSSQSQFVAVGTAGFGGSSLIATSPNGVTWTTRITSGGTSLYSVIWDPIYSHYVAVGENNSSAYILTSPTGTTWTLRTTPSIPGYGYPVSIVANADSNYIAVGAAAETSNLILSSEDGGVTWILQAQYQSNKLLCVTCQVATNEFVAVGYSILTSVGISAWNIIANPTVNNNLAIGSGAGTNLQNFGALAVGPSAGYQNQGTWALAIGDSAGGPNQGQYAVAMGYNAGRTNQNGGAVAIGRLAGLSNQGYAAVAVGLYSGQGQGPQAVAVGYQAGADQRDNAVAVGSEAGSVNQGANSIAVGQKAGFYYQNESAVAIGNQSGQQTQGPDAVAVGHVAGQNNQGQKAVAIGLYAGNTSQGTSAVAIGDNAGSNVQGGNTVAVGYYAGNNTQHEAAIAIGQFAGQDNQGNSAVGLGKWAGQEGQHEYAVAVGTAAGAFSQGNSAVAIGDNSGHTGQKSLAIAIGQQAGYFLQGANAIAIGAHAGDDHQGNNSIILNATGNIVDQRTDNTFTVAPVRNDTSNVTNALYYNTATFEISYGPAGGNAAAAGNAGDIQINVAGNIGADSTLRYVDTGGEMTLYADYLNAPGIFTSDIYAGDGTPSNITLTTSYGNAAWTFGSDGNLTIPGGGAVWNIGNGTAALTANIQDPQAVNLGLDYTSNTATLVGNSGVYIQTNSIANTKQWTFNADGNLTIPGAIRTVSNSQLELTESANTAYLGTTADDSTALYLTATTAQLYANGEVSISSNVGGGNAYGWAFDVDGNTNIPGDIISFGNIAITTNVGNTTSSWTFDDNGNLTLPRGGKLLVSGGIVGGGASPAPSLSGFSTLQAYGNITGGNILTGGYLSVAGNITLTDGDIISFGNIGITTNVGNTTSSWTFDDNGNLTLPGNTSSINYANGQPYGGTGGGANTGNVTFSNQTIIGTGDQYGGSGLYLAPGTESTGNLQYLRVRGGDYPTHIHFDTGNNQYFDQYFGDDFKYVKLEANGNIVINSNDNVGNTANWNFGTDGELYLPTGGRLGYAGKGWTGLDGGNGAPVSVTSYYANGFYAGCVSAYPDGNVGVTTYTGSSSYSWNFDSTGALNLPISLGGPFGGFAGVIQTANAYPTLLAYGLGGHGGPELDWTNSDDPANTFGSSDTVRNTLYLNGEAGLYVGFNENGNVGPYTGHFQVDTLGNVQIPTQNVGASTPNGTPGEATYLRGTRKAINGVYSGATNPFAVELAAGPASTVAYTATNSNVQSVRVTFAVQSTGNGYCWEQFDVVATPSQDTPGTVNYVVSNRIKSTSTVADTQVTAALNGSGQIEISLTPMSGQNGWTSFDAVEFGLMVD